MNNFINYSKTFLKHNSSTILTVAGATGTAVTAVMAVKATPKAMRIIDEMKNERGDDVSKLDIALAVAPAYIPTILIGVSSIACILGANILNKRAQASLMSAYALLDSSYKEYKAKVIDLYGEETSLLVREELAKDNYEADDEEHDDGTKLFYDEFSKRYFRATTEAVLRAEYEMNRVLNECGVASLNTYYDLVGLPEVDYGEYLGWSHSQMFEMYWESWLYFYHEKVTADDGTEFWMIKFTDPFIEFDEY